jgi:NitT/TauT family transport system ATP-binding protein
MLTTAVVGGSFDIAQNGYTSAAAAAVEGADVVIIGGISNKLPFQLVVPSSITSAAQLKGRPIAISRYGSSTDIAVDFALDHLKLTRDDVKVVQLGAPPNRIAALMSGQISGTVEQYPDTADLIRQGFRVLVDVTEIAGDYPNTSFDTTRHYLKSHPEVVKRFLLAMATAVHEYKNNPLIAIPLTRNFLQIKNEGDAKAAYEAAYDLTFVHLEVDAPQHRQHRLGTIVVAASETPRTCSLAGQGAAIGHLPGSFFIVGPSGCGKTTLLNVVDGLIRATAGTVLVHGQAIAGPGPDRAMVFQHDSLFPWRTVLQNVTYGLDLQGTLTRRERRERSLALVDLVGLSGFADHYPHELSGGMRQRVNIARALVMNPQLLLLDEPFAALDAQTREFMQVELLKILVRAKTTALFITHQINEAVFLSNRVVVMSARPACIKEIIAVELPPARVLAMKHEPLFHDLERRIWRLIEQDAGNAGTPLT